MAISFNESQREVIETNNKNIIVSASAGSGKTTVLAGRIVSKIADKNVRLDINRLLVVTFTRLAAAEMREKIRKNLLDAAKENPDDDYLAKQAVDVQNASITTIDSFCAAIVKENFETLGIDPNYRVATEEEIEIAKGEVIAELLEEYFAKKDAGETEEYNDFIDVMECFSSKKGEDDLEKVILSIHNVASAAPYFDEWLDFAKKHYEYGDSVFLQKWYEELSDMEYAKISGLFDEYTALGEEFTETYVDSKSAKTIKNELEAYTNALKCGVLDVYNYYKENASNDSLRFSKTEDGEAVKTARKAFKDKFEKIYKPYAVYDKEKCLESFKTDLKRIDTLCGLVKAFDKKYKEYKNKKNILEFNDIAHYALDILAVKDEDGVKPSKKALEIADSFDEVMVDEYQDTNYLQETIFSVISGEKVKKNNRFMVGDIKQSIYKFRNAETSIFNSKFEEYKNEENKDSKSIVLADNYRSNKCVLDSVNEVFCSLMNNNYSEIKYDETHKMNCGLQTEENPFIDNKTELLLAGKELSAADDKIVEEEIDSVEAACVASKIRELVDSKYMIFDKDTKEYRAVKYGDIVILARSANQIAASWTKIFADYGIPANGTEKSGFYDTFEVSVVVNYIRIAGNPTSDVSLVSVLKNVYGFTPEELAKIRIYSNPFGAKSFFEAVNIYLSDFKETSLNEENKLFFDKRLYNMIVRFKRDFDEVLENSLYMPIYELIENILDITGFEAMICGMPDGKRRADNVNKLKEIAKDYENTSFNGLYSFVRYIERIKECNVDTGEAPAASGGDYVRIMTVHASKGLEYPVVFVVRLEKKFHPDKGNFIADSNLGIFIDSYDVKNRIKSKSLLKEYAKERLSAAEYAEELRILYVAMTRARDKLYLAAAGKNETLEEFYSTCKKYASLNNDKNDKPAYFLSDTDFLNANSFFDLLKCVAKYGFKTVKVNEPRYFRLTLTADEYVKKRENSKQKMLHFITDVNNDIPKELLDGFSKKYKYEADTHIQNKYSVSDIKHAYMKKPGEILEEGEENDEAYPVLYKDCSDYEEVVTFNTEPSSYEPKYVPKFIKERDENKGAKRGTAYHRVFELLDYNKDINSKEDVEKQILLMVSQGLISDDAASVVNPYKVYNLVKSDIGKRMQKAARNGKLYRERQYVMTIPATEVKKDYKGLESVLVQGIIDAYIEEDGVITVIDYKTDRVDDISDLDGMYRKQLMLYTEAVSKILGKKTNPPVIYSVKFDRELVLD